MKYYFIEALSKEVDEKYKTHIHPTYRTCYNMNRDREMWGLQSGLTDALKFKKKENAEGILEKSIGLYGETHEFKIVEIDYTNPQLRFVYEDINEGVKCSK